jgi:hypothetical protein
MMNVWFFRAPESSHRPFDVAPICCQNTGSVLPKNNKSGRSSMIYEMRVYRCLPGRLPALLKRFETITLKLWEKHGIKQAGFFTTLIGESNQELTYFLAWDSLADRDKKWTAFQGDPDWISARAKTEEDGQIVGNIVSQLLVPTGFSSVK